MEMFMPFETITLKPKSLFLHKVEGYLIPSDLKKHIIDFWLDQDNMGPNVNVIWDLREANLTNISFETADYLANTIVENVLANCKPGLTALLINDSPEKHIAAYLANLLGSTQIRKIKMFHQFDQALKFVDVD